MIWWLAFWTAITVGLGGFAGLIRMALRNHAEMAADHPMPWHRNGRSF